MSGRAGSAAPAQNGGPAAAPERSPSLTQSYDLACKVMLLGDSGVGKTCFLLQFKDGAFLSGTFIATVGIDFRNKVVAVDGVNVKLQIWDTAGQERFRSVTHAYYRDAQALLLFYDITSKMSFDNIRAWLTEIHEYAQKDVVIMLLGNKADVSSERVIKMEDGESLAREYGVPFMETSAKTGMNVELAFVAIAKKSYDMGVQPSRSHSWQHSQSPASREWLASALPAEPRTPEIRTRMVRPPNKPGPSVYLNWTKTMLAAYPVPHFQDGTESSSAA
nr:ras-related protein Rab-37 isoform X2 [Chelonoidis abingdonii]